jgi:hypothetical protein
MSGLAGCLGNGGAVSVRWRIVERETGALHDPRDVADKSGQCCANGGSVASCATQPGWHITRVHLLFTDPTTQTPLANPPAGLDAACNARELTTPFELPEGLYAIALRAFDPAAPDVIQAQSPSPELRTVKKAEIVNLDVVELSVSVSVQ